MFDYVKDKNFLHRAQSCCSEIVKAVEFECRNDGLNGQVFLVGSGARNMVTQNGNGAIDFDYNLNVISCPNWEDAKAIKETVRKNFNKVMRKYQLHDVQDSTSSLSTDKLYFEDNPSVKFSIDLAIVTQNDAGIWERLIHEKTGFVVNDRYFWNKVKNSKLVREKSARLKKADRWLDVRTKYIDKKNKYLRQNDYNHPSFVCYIEAVNDVYNHYFY